MKSYDVTIQLEPLKQYFHIALFVSQNLMKIEFFQPFESERNAATSTDAQVFVLICFVLFFLRSASTERENSFWRCRDN